MGRDLRDNMVPISTGPATKGLISGAAILSIICLAGSVDVSNNFQIVTDCICPQDVVTYECTVCGLATAWEGTALDSCSGGEIALTNRDFREPIQTIICNGGAVMARGISVEDGCFISQLNVTLNATLHGRSVVCSVDNGTHAFQVGSATLALSTGPYPTPENVYLVEVSPAGLLFSWNQTQNCPSLRYNIQSENCGRCPNTTEGMSVNCSDFSLSNSITLCNFSVKTVICGINSEPIIGNLSDPVIVNLTVPAISQVSTIPHYSIDNGLRSLLVTFSEVDSFIIYEDINGTVTSYIINYSDSDTGKNCGSSEINSSLCENGVCSEEFDVSISQCRLRPSSDISVTVSAVTTLGEGPQTDPVMEGYQNNFVGVQVISESASINCTFLNNTVKEVAKSCDAIITYGENCQEQMPVNGMIDTTNELVVVISLRNFLEETMSSKFCSFRVNATVNGRTVIVDGNLLAISINNARSQRSVIIAAALVPIAILIVVIFATILAFSLYIRFYFKIHQRSMNITDVLLLQSKDTKFKMIAVPKECNMIDFAMEKIENYDPDSGKGYYQFIKGTEEYISPKTRVVLVSEDERQICTGRHARRIIGVSDKREKTELPDLSGSEWKYVFIQSTSRIQTLREGTLFMYYERHDNKFERQRTSSLRLRDDDKTLKLVDDKYKMLIRVPGDREYPVLEFTKNIEGIPNYYPKLGYGFYEFTKPEFISRDKQVILMDKDEKLYYGPGARLEIPGIRPGQLYDEEVEILPEFDGKKWKCVFIQTRSNIRKLQPNTWFLYCDVASSEMIRVLEPFKVFTVPEADEDERKILKFAKKNIPYYNPKAGYAYYEFTERKYVTSDKNIVALNKKGELFTGPGVRKLAGVGRYHDDTKETKAPNLRDTDWKCIFIQGKMNFGRLLEPNTQFLYCEYDHNPEVY